MYFKENEKENQNMHFIDSLISISFIKDSELLDRNRGDNFLQKHNTTPLLSFTSAKCLRKVKEKKGGETLKK